MIKKGTELHKIGLSIGFVVFTFILLLYIMSIPSEFNALEQQKTNPQIKEFEKPHVEIIEKAQQLQYDSNNKVEHQAIF